MFTEFAIIIFITIMAAGVLMEIANKRTRKELRERGLI